MAQSDRIHIECVSPYCDQERARLEARIRELEAMARVALVALGTLDLPTSNRSSRPHLADE